MKRVLVVEDEGTIADLVAHHLRREGYLPLAAGDGEEGLALAKKERPDLLILDLMLPGISGLDVCKHLKADLRTAAIPVIILTAKDTEADIVVGLEFGADDYVAKPFKPRELMARVKAVLRRGEARAPQDTPLRYGELEIDPAQFAVRVGGRAVELSSTEFRVLLIMAQNPGRVFSRQQILERLWGTEKAVIERTVDFHIYSLRDKLGAPGRWIKTVRGAGYKFDAASGA